MLKIAHGLSKRPSGRPSRWDAMSLGKGEAAILTAIAQHKALTYLTHH